MHKKDWTLLGAVCVLSMLFMLPRILSAQFGLLDDGVLLLSAQSALQDLKLIWFQYRASGRFLPTVLLIRALVFRFAGFSAELWYLWSAFQLILTTIIMFFIARKHRASRLQIALCILIFLASPSLVENFYTLSKAEIPLLLCVTGAILFASYYPSLSSKSAKILSIAGTFLLLLMGFGAKETAIVLPFMFLGWLGISWLIFKKSGEYHRAIKSDLILLLSSSVSGVVYWSARYLLGITGSASGGYASGYQLFDLEKLLTNLFTLFGWIIRDFPYLFPVFLGILLIKPLRRVSTLSFTLKWSLWLAVWAGILLPWYILAYYMLPFLFGAALLSGMVIGQMVHIAFPKRILISNDYSQPESKPVGRISKIEALFLIILAAMLLVPPLANTSAYVIQQLSIDRANGRFIKKMANLPPNSRLIIVTPEQLEYFREIDLMIHSIYQRNDIAIEVYSPPIEYDDQRDTFIASLVFKNQVLPGVRSVHGPTAMAWKACLENEAGASQKFFSAKIFRPIVDIGLHRLLPLKMDVLLGAERDIFIFTTFTYGWDVAYFTPTKANPEKPGVFKDGVFTLQTVSGNIRSVPFGQGDEIPLAGDIDGDGYSDLVLYDEIEKTWIADLDLDGNEDEIFAISNMEMGDIPILGDWDGDGKDTPGFFRTTDSSWYFLNSLSGGAAYKHQFGLNTDLPVVGDWDGDGIEDTGVYRPETGYAYLITDPEHLEMGKQLNGIPGAIPVAGYWSATNKSQVALVKDNTWTMFVAIFDCILPSPPKAYQFDYPGSPLAGVWGD